MDEKIRKAMTENNMKSLRAVALLTVQRTGRCGRVVKNFDPKSGCPDRGFHGLSQFLQSNAGIVYLKNRARSLSSKSIPIHHSVITLLIWRNIVRNVSDLLSECTHFKFRPAYWQRVNSFGFIRTSSHVLGQFYKYSMMADVHIFHVKLYSNYRFVSNALSNDCTLCRVV
jgi:hypothetical protein